jgi:hypothetical protein
MPSSPAERDEYVQTIARGVAAQQQHLSNWVLRSLLTESLCEVCEEQTEKTNVQRRKMPIDQFLLHVLIDAAQCREISDAHPE